MDKNKKATINLINKKDSFNTKITLNLKEILKDSQRISNIHPFLDEPNLRGIYCPSINNGWKKFEKSKLRIAFNVLSIKKMDVCPVYISKHNSNCEKQIIFLMIPKKKDNIIL